MGTRGDLTLENRAEGSCPQDGHTRAFSRTDPHSLLTESRDTGHARAYSRVQLQAEETSFIGRCMFTRRRTELAAVLAAELRRTVIADSKSHSGDILRIGEQPGSSLLQADLLLVLDGGHRRHSSKMPVERRHAHPRQLR